MWCRGSDADVPTHVRNITGPIGDPLLIDHLEVLEFSIGAIETPNGDVAPCFVIIDSGAEGAVLKIEFSGPIDRHGDGVPLKEDAHIPVGVSLEGR